MIGDRASALLQAAATIYAGAIASGNYSPSDAIAVVKASVKDAHELLSLIEAQEKAQLTPRKTARV